MRIDGNHIATPLKLVPQASAAPQMNRTSQTSPAPPPGAGAGSADSYSFETVYLRTLPIVTQTQAHRRLEYIRRELVAGRTEVPIHFEHPAPKSRNPYLPQHLRFGPEPTGLNESATDLAAEALQKKNA